MPIGTKDKIVMETDNFVESARLLKNADIRCCDFEEIIDLAARGDFLFVDPPYTVKHNLNGFLKYNEDIFKWSDQVRLRDSLLKAKGRGATIIVTNADHQSVRELYEKEFDYMALERYSVLAGSSSFRRQTTEAFFTTGYVTNSENLELPLGGPKSIARDNATTQAGNS